MSRSGSASRTISLLDGRAVVNGKTELREGHVELVHGGEVLPSLAIALRSRLLKLAKLLGCLIPLLLVHHLGNDGSAVLGQ
jgi:hypothetical protein